MSRQLVSYSELSEDAASLPVEVGVGRKRKTGAGRAGARPNKMSRSQGKQGAVLHWDDPEFIPTRNQGEEQEEEGGSYRAQGVEEDGEGEGETFWDATDHGEVDVERGSVTLDKGLYTQWKYDEWGEPYTTPICHRAFKDQDQDSYNQDDQGEEAQEGSVDYDYEAHSSLEEEEEEEGKVSIAIPDVAEFHRAWDAQHASGSCKGSSSSGLATEHRPPVAVGGGGRVLSHGEIYSPLTLVQAYNAALGQYCSMHDLPPPILTQKDHSALWFDAPHHSSLLAHQVKADTHQILQQQTQQQPNPSSHAIHPNPTRRSNPNQNTTNSTETATRAKPVVNVVPHAHLVGNSAWSKAVKTVQTTPNSIGLPTPTLPPPPKTETDTLKEEPENEKLLHQYWYAGYYAGLAAANSSTTATTTTANGHSRTAHSRPCSPKAS